MVWHIKKTSMFGSGVGTVYYRGNNRWTETFADRATYTDEFLKIIRYVIKDANVFVISHKPDLQEKFENVIRFEKIKGFSRMAS